MLLLACQANLLYGQAQTGQSEVGLSRGSGSVFQIVSTIGASLAQDAPPMSTAGNGYYRYYVSHSVSVGVSGGIEQLRETGNYGYNVTCFSLTPELTWSYLDRSRSKKGINAKLYGTAALGASYIHEKGTNGDNSVEYKNEGFLPIFQLTPIGIRVGRSFGVFGELGFGYKGVFNFGVNMRFPAVHKHN